MGWKSLMVAVDAGPDCAARIRLACRLAKAFDAHLIGVGASVSTPAALADPYVGGGVSAETLEVFRNAATEELQILETTFLETTAAARLQAEWRGRNGYPADIIRAEARAADLIVVGRRSELCDTRAPDPGDVLLATGRPVLVVPPEPARDPLGTPALVAWRDTGEARRALTAALPILARAEAVRIVSVVRTPPTELIPEPMVDQMHWLARHSVQAVPDVRGSLQEVGDELLDAAQEYKAGLIVAGAYGHARLREWVLGGVTRTLLTQGDACVLFAH